MEACLNCNPTIKIELPTLGQWHPVTQKKSPLFSQRRTFKGDTTSRESKHKPPLPFYLECHAIGIPLRDVQISKLVYKHSKYYCKAISIYISHKRKTEKQTLPPAIPLSGALIKEGENTQNLGRADHCQQKCWNPSKSAINRRGRRGRHAKGTRPQRWCRGTAFIGVPYAPLGLENGPRSR
jgi:hypothetical protein